MQNVILPFLSQRKYVWFLQAIFLLMLFFPSIVSAQNISVSGTVSDKLGSLPGVSVVVKGTNTGTATDFDGNYTIEAPSNAVLQFSSIGFATQEVPVNGQSVINVTMQDDLQQLDEVIVVGYGVQRKEAVTGSVASIRGDEIREVPSSNISQALQGRLPGVEFSQTSSKPGAPMQIRIRGQRSLTASNDPLIVLDGIPFSGSIADINPNDIEGIDILKDASATAIYGSRGANGVILVTTNRGQRGQKAQIRYNSFYGLKTAFGRYPMMSGPEFLALRQAAGLYAGVGADESEDTDTDWQDLFYGTGIVTSHDVSVSGGTEGGSYSFNIGYHNDEAIIPIQEYERFSLRGTLDQQISKSIRLGFTTNNNYSVITGNDVGVGPVLGHSPLASPYNEDGTPKRTILLPLDEQFVRTREVYESFGNAYADLEKVFGSYNNIYAEVEIPGIEGLKYRANVGLNLRMTMGGDYRGEGIFSSNPTTLSQGSTYNSLNTRWLIENLLTYDRTFAEKHQLNIVGLYSAEQTKYNRASVVARDIPADHFQFYNLGQALGEISIDPDTQQYEVSGLKSWMGRVMYSYDGRYMLSATVRSDGSSRLAEGNKWHTYPAVSLGWNIANEGFMENVDWLNLMKLRAGYGETSNQAIAPYATLGRLGIRPYNFGSNFDVGGYVTQLPNPNLGWEYSTTYNIGLDFSVLNNRLSSTFEYYKTNTNDILLGVGLPPTSGVGGYTANIGETENKGWEFSLNAAILDDPDGWSWDLGFNIYSNKNELVALASGQERNEGNLWFVGHPINVLYDYERVGLWQEGDPYLDILEPGGNVGMIKVKYTGDFNPDGTPTRAIGPDDRQILDVNPDFQGGFNTRIAYKGFDISAVGVYRSGGIVVSTLYGSASYLNLMSGRSSNVQVDYWTPENTDARYPAPGGIRTGDNPKYQSTSGYFDGSYLKMRTISLGYNFKQNTLENLGLENLRLYFTLQNPFVLFSDYHKESGMDPETNSFGDENAAVGNAYPERILTIGTNTPSTRNYLIGLNVTF